MKRLAMVMFLALGACVAADPDELGELELELRYNDGDKALACRGDCAYAFWDERDSCSPQDWDCIDVVVEENYLECLDWCNSYPWDDDSTP